MEIMNAVKGIIERMRAAGKTESEISGIIADASEKATVNRAINTKKGYEAPEITVSASTERLKEALKAAGITMEDAAKAMRGFRQKERAGERKDTNNGRRMYGLPMKRKRRTQRSGKRERADSHPKDADVS